MDIKELKKYCFILCDYYIKEFPLETCNENYENIIYNEIISNLEQFKNAELDKNIETMNDAIKNFIQDYFDEKYVKRCDGPTYVSKLTNDEKEEISKQLIYLKNIYQPQQRTDEWYIFRQEHLTASNLWKVFGTKSSINQLIYEKCQPLNIDKYKGSFAETPMSWGQKYEDVSIMIYEDKYSTKIYDYGCVPHEKYEFIAASPDGINDDKESPLFGRMLEIKNIYNRKINGIPKKEYWIQMQLQMEVCNLNECDFLETRFKEYSSYDEFMQDGTFKLTKNDNIKGIIMYIIDRVNKCPKYLYMPLHYNIEEYKKWEEENIEKFNNEEYEWLKNIYWRLDEFSCVLVKRNKYWFEKAITKLNHTWEIIKKEKNDGSYIKRAPKSKKSFNTDNYNTANKCVLNEALIILE